MNNINKLRVKYYLHQIPFNKKEIDDCDFCGKYTNCYSNAFYRCGMYNEKYINICSSLKQELTSFPEKMMLIHYLLNTNLVTDVRRIIQLLLFKGVNHAACFR